MRLILFLTLSLFNSFIGFPQVRLDSMAGFRGSYWGESQEEVKKKEESRYLQTSNGWGLCTISYQGEIVSLPCRIDYTFKDDKLIEGAYTFQSLSSLDSNFWEIKKFLESKYGKPRYVNINGINPDSVWTAENPYGLYKGPQFFWEYSNGFICLHSSKIQSNVNPEEITITLLFVFNMKIGEYYEERLIPLI